MYTTTLRTATVSDIVKYGRSSRELPPNMLQFSSDATSIIVWNTTNRCSLSCDHCYIDAKDCAYVSEFTTDEAKKFIDNLAGIGVPVLLFSGSESLLRHDLFELGAYAKANVSQSMGRRPSLLFNRLEGVS